MKLIPAITCIMLILSCKTNTVVSDYGIQKRKYRKGWFTNTQTPNLTGNKVREANVEKSQQIITPVHKESQPAVVTHLPSSNFEKNENKPTDTASNEQISTSENSGQHKPAENKPCDIIMLKNGDEIEAKVTEIGSSEIKYKQCNNQEGPVFTIIKQDVFKIKYANGTSTLISEISNQQKTPITLGSGTNASNDQFRGTKIAAIVGIILAILGFLVSPLLGLLLTGIAFGIGIWALSKLNRLPKEQRDRKTRNLALWSLILGGIGLLLGLVVFVL